MVELESANESVMHVAYVHFSSQHAENATVRQQEKIANVRVQDVCISVKVQKKRREQRR